jgi:hypothetical protein
MLFIFLVHADIDIAIWIYLVALALLLIVCKFSLEDSAVFVKRNASTVFTVLEDLSKVYSVFIFDQFQIWRFDHFRNCCAEDA